jgi:hypothetical protein
MDGGTLAVDEWVRRVCGREQPAKVGSQLSLLFSSAVINSLRRPYTLPYRIVQASPVSSILSTTPNTDTQKKSPSSKDPDNVSLPPHKPFRLSLPTAMLHPMLSIRPLPIPGPIISPTQQKRCD